MLLVPDVRQTASHDCGVAVCRAVMRFHGKRWSDDYDKRLGVCEIDGTDPRNIEVLFRQLGFGVISGEMTVADLRFNLSCGRPVITLIQRQGVGHYIVVSDVTPRTIGYQCPVDGFCKVSTRKFRAEWKDVGRMGAVYHSFGIVPHRKGKG